ncbi:uncharacterized protein Pyn_01955 [Prunus yedoensis var. nudiflora]|uniref:Uncharacterized protein n=1 Tax=Prunus yedoensis var. nudiflora TaxID=2094558 RepID=A0A314YRB8_PRUYE|nr:uncharacterized protein Pyn_01955 [Prunus yedoensis var. nudiflora]
MRICLHQTRSLIPQKLLQSNRRCIVMVAWILSMLPFVPELPISDEISEIVQIPLDENEVRNLELSVETDKNAAVPLIDAPLIGAPFRLMSFVARYVSGADLVNQAPTNSSH